jgi:HTH-type transcriptional regulator / antitoxin HipB
MIRRTTITDPLTFGATLRAARRARGLRLEDVAFGAGVGPRFVSELERGKPTARLGEALRVAGSLGLGIVVEDPGEWPLEPARGEGLR